MEKKIKELEADFSSFVRYGQWVLNCTEEQIKEHFPENQITVFPNSGNSSLLEVWINYGTLTCQIDNSGTCHAVFLFFDDEDLFDVYKKICNDQCEIIAPNVWKYDNYHIELKESRDAGFYFNFRIAA